MASPAQNKYKPIPVHDIYNELKKYPLERLQYELLVAKFQVQILLDEKLTLLYKQEQLERENTELKTLLQGKIDKTIEDAIHPIKIELQQFTKEYSKDIAAVCSDYYFLGIRVFTFFCKKSLMKMIFQFLKKRSSATLISLNFHSQYLLFL